MNAPTPHNPAAAVVYAVGAVLAFALALAGLGACWWLLALAVAA